MTQQASPPASGPTQLILDMVWTHPGPKGLTRAQIIERLVAQGAKRGSISPTLFDLRTRGKLRGVEEVDGKGKVVMHYYWPSEPAAETVAKPAAKQTKKKPAAAPAVLTVPAVPPVPADAVAPPSLPAAAAADSTPPSPQTPAEDPAVALLKRRQEVAAKAREVLAAKRAAAKAAGVRLTLKRKPKVPPPEPVAPEPVVALAPPAPVPTPTPAPAVTPEPVVAKAAEPVLQTTPDSRKRRVVHWNQAEIEAVCMKWASDHVRIATGLSDKALRDIARLDGYGYRPRDIQPEPRRKFIAEHMPLVQQLIQELREAKKVVTPEPPAEAPAAPAEAKPLTLGALIDQALDRAVKESVDAAVARALLAQEQHLLEALADMLRGIPGYNRPILIKRTDEPAVEEKLKPLYQVIVLGGLPAQFDSVRRAFPQLDVRLVTGRVPGEEDPDLVVGVTRFLSHSLEKAVKKKYGERYVPLPPSGAAAQIKETIARKLQVSYAH